MAATAFWFVVDFLLQALELGERLVALLLDRALLHRVAAVDEVGPQHVDPVLERLRERLAALHLAARFGHAPRPVGLIANLAAGGRSWRGRAGGCAAASGAPAGGGVAARRGRGGAAGAGVALVKSERRSSLV